VLPINPETGGAELPDDLPPLDPAHTGVPLTSDGPHDQFRFTSMG
jgi:hypothetical protein